MVTLMSCSTSRCDRPRLVVETTPREHRGDTRLAIAASAWYQPWYQFERHCADLGEWIWLCRAKSGPPRPEAAGCGPGGRGFESRRVTAVRSRAVLLAATMWFMGVSVEPETEGAPAGALLHGRGEERANGSDLAPAEVAVELRCSRKLVYRLIERGELPGTYELPGSNRKRIPRADLDALKERQGSGAPQVDRCTSRT